MAGGKNNIVRRISSFKADFFFVPAGDGRILLVSVDRPYGHGDMEEKIRLFLKDLSG